MKKALFTLLFFTSCITSSLIWGQTVTFSIDNFVGALDNDSGSTSETVGGVTYVLSLQIVPFSGNVLSEDIGGGDLLFFESAPAGVDCTITADGQPISFNLVQADVDAVGSSTYEWRNNNGDLIFSGTTVNGTIRTDNFAANNMNITGFNVNASNDFPGWHNIVINNITVLPVELISFEAQIKTGATWLFWETASELNNEKFEIEESKDGREFQKIGEVEGNGTTLEQQNYSFEVNNPRNGVSYYRLKQIDFDGQFEYSKVISVNFKGENGDVGEFYPNPSTGLVNLDYHSKNDEAVAINIFDITGKQIAHKILQVSRGENNLSIDFSDLNSGIYIVRFGEQIEATHRKLIIE